MNYIEQQLYKIAPFPVLAESSRNGQIRVKFTSGARGGTDTNWMNLTPEQFHAIELLVASHPAFNEVTPASKDDNCGGQSVASNLACVDDDLLMVEIARRIRRDHAVGYKGRVDKLTDYWYVGALQLISKD